MKVSLTPNSPITREQWDKITDAELERTEEITIKTPSGKEVPFRKVKHGEWIDYDDDYGSLMCSICEKDAPNDIPWDFCPYCGADMRGETDEYST